MMQTYLTTQLNESINDLLSIYSGNGNIIGVLLLSQELFSDDYKNNSKLRKSLASWGQLNNVDSIMVLTGNPALCQEQAYHFRMDVFEPQGDDNSGMMGSWSAMCGNGMMAVSLFFENRFGQIKIGDQILIQTRSGLRISTKVGSSRYSVCMGEFTHDTNDIKKYLSHGLIMSSQELLQTRIPSSIYLGFSDFWSIGFSGDRTANGHIDGEPHVVMFKEANGQRIGLAELRDIAVRHGALVTKNIEFFPRETNANFAIVQNNNKKQRELNMIACTHERGLGNNSDHSVTDACGTGATAIAATLYRVYYLEDGYIVNVRMPGGLLQVYRNENKFYLIGNAKKLQNHI